jgi:hypothetical protein
MVQRVAVSTSLQAQRQLAYTTAPEIRRPGIRLLVLPCSPDSFGNGVSSTASITVAIGMKPGSGTLSGTTTKNTVSGVANFNDLSVEKSGTGYTMAASATGLTGATSSAFNVSAGAANKLAFSVQPGNAGAGAALSGPPTVVVQDSLGNTITSSSASITLAIGTNPSGGILSGTKTKNASSGVAVFNDLSINKSGTGYTLSASASGLAGVTSGVFTISSGVASQLTFTTQPTNTTAGYAIPGPTTVAVRDSQGNTVTSSTASITIAVGNNPSSGTLSGTTTKNAVSGVATFNDLSINNTGTGYTLTASSVDLSGIVGYWKFDEGSGTTAVDSSGNDLNGSFVNSPTWSAGYSSQALNLNGTSSYVDLGGGIGTPFDMTGPVFAPGLTPEIILKISSGNESHDRSLVTDFHQYRLYINNSASVARHNGARNNGGGSASTDIGLRRWIIADNICITYRRSVNDEDKALNAVRKSLQMTGMSRHRISCHLRLSAQATEYRCNYSTVLSTGNPPIWSSALR